jgi:hypothetical protein
MLAQTTVPANSTTISIFQLDEFGQSHLRACLSRVETAIVGANAMVLNTGTIHFVEVATEYRTARIYIHPTGKAEATGSLTAEAASAFLRLRDKLRVKKQGDEAASLMQGLKYQSGTEEYSVFTTRSFEVAKQAVQTWKGATMRRNGRANSEKGQSYLVRVPRVSEAGEMVA